MLRKHTLGVVSALLPIFVIACDASEPDAAAPLRPASGVAVSPKYVEVVALGEVAQLTATLAAPSSTQRPVWSSLDPQVAVVDADGRVVSVARGQARIVVNAGAFADTARVSVTQVPEYLTIRKPASGDPDADLTTVGQRLVLEADVRDRKDNPIPDAQTTWISLDPDVLVVSAGGLVEAKGNGNGKVVGKSGNANDTTNVRVSFKAVAVSVLPNTHVLTSLGDVVPLQAEARDANGEKFPASGVLWQSLASSVATVNAEGYVTAVRNGTARVMARLAGNVTDTATITVQQQAASVTIQPSQLALLAGQIETATASVHDARSQRIDGAQISWSTGTAAIASVDAAGRVTGRGAGTTTLTASSGGRSASINVTVTLAPVATVTVSPASNTLAPGSGTTLSATLRDASGAVLEGRAVEWRTSNAAVASVTAAGHVSAVAPGSATITALSEGRSGSAQVAVVAAPAAVASVSLAPSSVALQIGATAQLSATLRDGDGNLLSGRAVSWSSSNPAVASPNSSGLVSAHATGAATITATSEGRSATAQVSVQCALDRVVIMPRADTIRALGETRQFTATAFDGSGTLLPGVGIVWSVITPMVATVNSAGTVTAQQLGTAFLVATATLGGCEKSDTVGVVVEQTVENITLTPSPVSLPVGSSLAVEVTATDARGNRINNPNLAWSTASTDIATVDQTGRITGRNQGNTQLTVTSTRNGRTASAPVQVVQQQAGVHTVTVSPSASSVAAGSAITLSATARDSAGQAIGNAPIAWTSSNPAVATVQNGQVIGVSAGSAIITASSGGRSGTAAVNVTVQPSTTVATVTVTPANASVAVGGTTTLAATARDAANNVIGSATFSWSSNAPAVASVAGGVVTGVSAGSAVITVSSGGRSATTTVTVTGGSTPPPPPPPTTPPPSGVFFFDGFESGDFSHRQNSMFWSSGTSVPAPGTIPGQQAFQGNYAARSRYSAAQPARDAGSGPSEIRFRIAPVDQSTYTKVWVEYYLYIPANHFHADQSTRGQQFWRPVNLQAGTNRVTGPAGTFQPQNKGVAVAFPGAGLPGDDGLAANILRVISDTEVELTQLYSYRLNTGQTVYNSKGNATYTSAVPTIPTSVSGVEATKIRLADNHKHFTLWGRQYLNNTQLPHAAILLELWPTKNTDPNYGDSDLALYIYRDGRNYTSLGRVGPGVQSSGPGLRRGQWNRVRVFVDTGSPGASNGVVRVWYNNDLIVDRSSLALWPVAQSGDTYQPYPWWDAGYINGYANGGFMQDTDYYVDNFATYLSNPGW